MSINQQLMNVLVPKVLLAACFYCDLFLCPVRCPRVLGWSLNGSDDTGQAATLAHLAGTVKPSLKPAGTIDNTCLIWISNAPSNRSAILVMVARIALCSFYETGRREARNICLHDSFVVYRVQ